jgi:HTH-type transcriptional regulator / antitoxin HigA
MQLKLNIKNSKMKIEINSKKEYHEMMVEIYKLMNKGEGKLTKSESTRLSQMAIVAESYEENVLGLKPFKEPANIPELVEFKLFEHKMTQAKLAEEIGIAKSKVSEILNGKRMADISFLKGIHKVLKIDAGLLLEIV